MVDMLDIFDKELVFIFDDSGKILFVNDGIQEYGYVPYTLIGTSVLDLTHQSDKEKFSKFLENDEEYSPVPGVCTTWIVTKDKTPIPFIFRREQTGECVKVLSISRDGAVQATLYGKQYIARDISASLNPAVLTENDIRTSGVHDLSWENDAAAEKMKEESGFQTNDEYRENSEQSSHHTLELDTSYLLATEMHEGGITRRFLNGLRNLITAVLGTSVNEKHLKYPEIRDVRSDDDLLKCYFELVKEQ